MEYHSGEIAVQTKAGVRRQADRLAAGIRGSISPDRREFAAAQRMAVFGTMNRHGGVWASVVTGKAGFLQAPDEHTIGSPRLRSPAIPYSKTSRRRRTPR